MSIEITGKIAPKNSGSFPTHEDTNTLGGFQVRNDITDRDSIPTANRKIGMLAYVISDGKYYTLSGGITNGDWVEANLGGNSLKPIPINFGAGIISTNSNIFVVAGTLRFNTSQLTEIDGTKTIKLKCIAETTGPLITIKLYNYTTVSDISGSTLTTSSTTPIELSTGDLTSALASGDNIYQILMKMDPGTEVDRITLSSSIFEIDWI